MLKIGDSCNFTCKDNRLQKSYTRVKCSSGGVWVPNKDLCREFVIQTCPAAIKNGRLSQNCNRQATNTECKFTCDKGFKSRLKNDVLVCHTSGQWSFNTDTLCKGTASLVAAQTSPEVVALGAGLGTLVFVLVVVIIIVMLCCLRNRQRSKEEEEYFDDSTTIPRRSSQKQLVLGKSNEGDFPPADVGGAYVSISQRGQGFPSSQQQGITTQRQTTDDKPQFKSVINIAKQPSGNPYERF